MSVDMQVETRAPSLTIPGIGVVTVPCLSTAATVDDLPDIGYEPFTFPKFANMSDVLDRILKVGKEEIRDEETRAAISGIAQLSITTCISMVLPAIGRILEELGIQEKTTSQAILPEGPTSTAWSIEKGHAVRHVTLEALCTLVKPYVANSLNVSYISTRYKAFCAGQKIVCPSNLVSMTLTKWYSTMSTRQDAINKICVYLVLNEEVNPQRLGLLEQVNLVWAYQEMSMTTIMYKFITESTSKALLSTPILREAAQFKTAYEAVKTKLGVTFPYAKIMRNKEVDILNHRNYPNLYSAAYQFGITTGLLTKNIVFTAGIGTSMPLEAIEREVKAELPPGARTLAVGASTEEQLSIIGIDARVVLPSASGDKLLERIAEALTQGGRGEKRQRTV